MKVGEGQDFTSHRHVGSRLRMRRIMLETSEQQLGKAFIGCHAADLHCNTLRWWRMANNPGAQSCLLCYLRKYELAVLGPRDIRYSVVRRDRRFAFVRHLRSYGLNASTPVAGCKGQAALSDAYTRRATHQRVADQVEVSF